VAPLSYGRDGTDVTGSGRWGDGPVRVRVPATSANLGPGFDALGLALALHDEVEAEVTGDGLKIEVAGEGAGAGLADAGEDHLVVRAMRAAFAAFGSQPPGPQPPGLRLRCTNRIPHGRGLGSSAAAIVAGTLLAGALGADPRPPRASLSHSRPPEGLAVTSMPSAAFELAADLEGHPDNVAACVAGGLTIAWTAGDGARMIRLDPLASIRPVVCIAPPEIAVRTEIARRALPASVPHRDAAANAGRAALLVAAMTADPEQLFEATQDWLHQDYRAAAMPDTHALVAALRAAGLPAVVSGAGPSVLTLLTNGPDLAHHLDMLGSIVRETGKAWHISLLDVERQGARLERPGDSEPLRIPPLRDTDSCEGMP
jgi:homoserine kinase